MKSRGRVKKKVDVNGDVHKGDPAVSLLGKDEEQSARVHAPQPPKPAPTARSILADIKLRRQELEPLVEEHKRLEAGYEAIKGI